MPLVILDHWVQAPRDPFGYLTSSSRRVMNVNHRIMYHNSCRLEWSYWRFLMVVGVNTRFSHRHMIVQQRSSARSIWCSPIRDQWPTKTMESSLSSSLIECTSAINDHDQFCRSVDTNWAVKRPKFLSFPRYHSPFLYITTELHDLHIFSSLLPRSRAKTLNQWSTAEAELSQ